MLARLHPTFTDDMHLAEPSKLPPGGRANNHIIQQTQFHHGPLPTPEAFEKYNRVLLGAADRILRMAEKQAIDGAYNALKTFTSPAHPHACWFAKSTALRT